MSVFNLVTAGLQATTAMTQSGRPDRNPVHRRTSAWPLPEGMYWGI